MSRGETFDKPSQALAVIPKGTPFIVREGTGGRPTTISPPEGDKYWSHDSFTKALAEEEIPRTNLILRPILEGRISSKRINLDLSISDESMTVEGMPATQPQMGMSPSSPQYLQAEVVQVLVSTLQDERTEKWELFEDLKGKDEKILKLELEISRLRNELENAQHADSPGQVASKMLLQFSKGPGILVVLSKLFGSMDPKMLEGMLTAEKPLDIASAVS